MRNISYSRIVAFLASQDLLAVTSVPSHQSMGIRLPHTVIFGTQNPPYNITQLTYLVDF